MKSLNNLIKKKKVGLIIFARMSSKRLPGKVLKKIYNNNSTCQIIINNLKKEKLKNQIIVATSKLKSDKKIVNLCKINKIKFFLGSNKNVFERTIKCIEKHNLEYIVRICADRPFFDVSLMKKMIKLIFKNKFDIITNSKPRTYPRGFTCEVAKTKIFRNINVKKLLKDEKEHIFNFFYKNNKYKIFNLKSNFTKTFINKNFCIDSKNDLIKIRRIFIKFQKLNKEININNIYKYAE